MSIHPIKKTLAAALLAVISTAATPALASQADTSNPAFAPVGAQTSIPVGHAEFCRSHRADCSPNANVVPMVELSQGLWQQLLSVNAKLNAAIVPETDEDLYHVAEFWTYPHGFGDCEDIALAKRQKLIAAGWPASTLLMAVVREEDGEGHAVLMVRTDRGDLVLDNQDGAVRVWNDTPYRYIKRQSQADQGEWVDILDQRATIIAAAH
jgi:predicted transglutaminase-like cysteine proteinase